MPNLRLYPDNAADRATLTATDLPRFEAVALRTDDRTLWRSPSTSATLTLTWPAATPEWLDCIAICHSNLSSAASWRIVATLSGVTVLDTGDQPAHPPQGLGGLVWGLDPLGLNAYTYATSPVVLHWCDLTQADTLTITLTDPSNPAGYLQACRLIVGYHWSPSASVAYGAELSVIDTAKRERTEAGQLVCESGAVYRVMRVSLPVLNTLDRQTLFGQLARRTLRRPLLVALYPDASDAMQDRDYAIWGYLPTTIGADYPSFQRWQSKLEIEEA